MTFILYFYSHPSTAAGLFSSPLQWQIKKPLKNALCTRSLRFFSVWSRRWDLNPQPADYDSAALPIELRRQMGKWCRRAELNCRHVDFQSTALPTELPRRIKVAELTGVEPAISCVTGRHVRPLHHSSALVTPRGFEPLNASVKGW